MLTVLALKTIEVAPFDNANNCLILVYIFSKYCYKQKER